MADWNALLPSAPAASTNILSDPTKALGLVGQLNQIQLFNQIYKAREGVGEAYRNSINPDGTVDVAKRNIGAANAGFLAPETTTAVQSQEGQRIQNITAQLQQDTVRRGIVDNFLGTLPPNASMDQVRHGMTVLSRHYGPDVLPSSTINATISDLSDSRIRSERIAAARDRAIGPAGLATPIEGQITGTGQKRTVTAGGFLRGDNPNAPASFPSVTTTLPTGSEKSIGIMQEHLARAGNFGQEIFPWQQALEKLKSLGPGGTGPGSKGRQEFESFIYSASPAIAQMMGVNQRR